MSIGSSFATRLRSAAAALVCVAALFPISPLQADILARAGQSDTRILFGGASYIIDFNSSASGGTVYNFKTTAADTQIAVFFSAECGVEGATNKSVDVDIIVDPAGSTPPYTLIPTAGGDILCSGNGTSTTSYPEYYIDGMVRVTVVAHAKIAPKGTHTIQVRLNGNSSLSRLHDLSLVVMR